MKTVAAIVLLSLLAACAGKLPQPYGQAFPINSIHNASDKEQ